MKNKKNYTGIDVMKFIMAIFVVAIHTHPFEGIEQNILVEIWSVLVRFAVPFFFMAAGFFLFSKLNKYENKEQKLTKIREYGKRILQLYIYWTIIFLPITIWKFATNDLSTTFDFLMFIRGIFFVGENFYSWPLWFLLSIIYALVVIYFLISIGKNNHSIFKISVGFFLISVIIDFIIGIENGNETLALIQKAIKYSIDNGRLLSGMLYIMIGAQMAKTEFKLSNITILLFLLIGITFRIFSIDLISPITFALLPTALFYLTTKWNLSGFKNGPFFRKCSTVMYFTHMIVFFIFTLVFREFLYYGMDAFLISTIIPIILTPLIIQMESSIPILKKLF